MRLSYIACLPRAPRYKIHSRYFYFISNSLNCDYNKTTFENTSLAVGSYQIIYLTANPQVVPCNVSDSPQRIKQFQDQRSQSLVYTDYIFITFCTTLILRAHLIPMCTFLALQYNTIGKDQQMHLPYFLSIYPNTGQKDVCGHPNLPAL